MIIAKLAVGELAHFLPDFTYYALEAIEQYLDECPFEDPLTLTEFELLFAEVEEEDLADYDEDEIIAALPNGNYLVER